MSRRDFQVLYVDGNALHAQWAAEALDKTRVMHVKDGLEALNYLRGGEGRAEGRRPDIILLELHSRGTGGGRLLTELKMDGSLRQIPVVVLASSSTREEVLEAYDSFANCYVTKPADDAAFKRMLGGLGEFWFGVAKLPGA